MLGNYYAYDSIGPVAEQLSRELHFSDTQIGTLNAIYSLPNIFLVVIGGVLVDRFSARRMSARHDRGVPGGSGRDRARRALSGDGRRPAAVRHRLRNAVSRGPGGAGAVVRRALFRAAVRAQHKPRAPGLLPRRPLAFVRRRSVRAGLAAAAVARGRLCRGLLRRRAAVLLRRPARGAARHAGAAADAGALRLAASAQLSRRVLAAGRGLRGVLLGHLPLPQHLCHQVPAAGPGAHAGAGEHAQQLRVSRQRVRHAGVRAAARPDRPQHSCCSRRARCCCH